MRCRSTEGTRKLPTVRSLFRAVLGLLLAALPFAAQASVPFPNVRVDDAGANRDVQSLDLASDGAGIVHAAYAVDSNPGAVRYTRSTAFGSLWTPSAAIYSSGSFDRGSVRLAADASGGPYDGYVYAAFKETTGLFPVQSVRVVRSPDRGLNWWGDVTVYETGWWGELSDPDIAVDGVGTVLVVWSMPAGEEVHFARSTDGGAGFGGNTRVDDGNSGTNRYPVVEASGDYVYVAYKAEDEGVYKVIASPDRGANWGATAYVAACSDAGRRRCSLAVSPLGGRVFLAYEDVQGGISLMLSDNRGQTWTGPIQVNDPASGGVASSPSLAAWVGELHAYWADARSRDGDIYRAVSTDDGGTWGAGVGERDARVDDTDANASALDDASSQSWPRAAVAQGYAVAAWLDNRDDGTRRKVYGNGGPRPIFTEVRDEPASNALIELYNPLPFDVDLTAFSLQVNGQPSVTLSGTARAFGTVLIGAPTAVPAPTIPLPLNIGPDSASIVLLDSRGLVVDRADYGTLGLTPDPMPAASAARRYVGGAQPYANEWSFQQPTTFGSLNTSGGVKAKPEVILNEVLYNPVMPQVAFVEIICKADYPVDLAGYRIQTDQMYTIPSGWVSPDAPYFFVSAATDPTLFTTLSPASDNVYLYDPQGNLLDMVGWSSAHTAGLSVARVPEGEGTYDGYEDVSTALAGWKYDQVPSLPIIYVFRSQVLRGELGDTLSFPLTITNNQDKTDVIDITLSARLGTGWTAGVYDGIGVSRVPDLYHPDGRPDVQLGPHETAWITVKVDMPSRPPTDPQEIYDLAIQSASTPYFMGSVALEADFLPYIWLSKTILPDHIYIEGTGHDEEATISLYVNGAGYPVKTATPLDLVFLMDTSGSMENSSIDIAKTAMKNLVDDMSADDRGAVVEFDDTAWLVDTQHLTADKALVKTTIDHVGGSGGATDMGDAVYIANDELLNYGTPGHIRAQILLTDGEPTAGPDVVAAAQQAADNGIIIYTVGLGAAVNEPLLQQIANMTGGIYFYADSVADLDGIYAQISDILNILTAGKDIDLTDANPMVRDVLPPYIHFVAGSAFDPDTGQPYPPDRMFTDGLGNTTLEWQVPLILIGWTWNVSFRVTSNRPGLQLADVVPESRADYVNWEDEPRTVLFPEAWVTVLAPTAECPLGLPDEVKLVQAARVGQDIQWYWALDPKAEGGYNIYNSDMKTMIPYLRRDMGFTPVAVTVSPPHTMMNVVSTGSTMLYYQVVGVCRDRVTEGPTH